MFSQKGLMYNLTLEGSKYTKLKKQRTKSMLTNDVNWRRKRLEAASLILTSRREVLSHPLSYCSTPDN